jgi:hypothetical protein
MKRIVALALSSMLALSVSPAVHATERPVTNTVSAAPLATPFADEVARGAADRKKCTFMCVQSRLPKVEYAIYFVNDDSDLLMFDDDGIVLRDLDTKQDELTAPYPSGVDANSVRTAISADHTEIYFYAGHSSGTGRVYRVSLGDLSVTLVATVFDEVDLPTMRSIFVAPDHSGFYLLYQGAGGGDRYLCQYQSDGTQQACSDPIDRSNSISPIFSNESGTRLYLMTSLDKRYEFDTTNDLAVTSTTINGLAGQSVNFELGTQASNGNMFFFRYTRLQNTMAYKVPIVGNDSTSMNLGLEFNPASVIVPREIEDRLYVVGQPFDSRGSQRSYATLFAIDGVLGNGAMTVKSSAKIKGFGVPQKLSVDSAGRYLLAHSHNSLNRPTLVMPVGTNRSVWARTSTEYTYCPAQGWNVSWDYINLAPGKTLTHYSMMYKGPGARKWQALETFPATGLRSVPVPRGVEAGGEIKVVPKGIKLRKVTTSQLVVVPPAPRPGDPQPGC